MLLKIRHAVFEISNEPINKKSAIIINNEIIITSGSILEVYLRANDQQENTTKECPKINIIKKLQQCQLINAQDEETEEAKYLNSLNYLVTFDRKKLPNANKRQATILSRYRAKILYLFNDPEISRNLHKFLLMGNEESSRILVSSFLVLSMRNTKQKETFERFLLHIGHYLRYLHSIRPLDDVLAMCTPFGLENFYKTISIGKVSNVMGRDSCLFSISNPLPVGCEGSAIFNNKLRLVGMIICTSFVRNNENVNLTLAANFTHLLRNFSKQLGFKITSISIPRAPSNFPWERALVVIEGDDKQGTGTFIKVHNKKFILTCSHVVFQLNSEVFCRSINGEFKSDVVWSNPNYDQPFDVALLSVPSNIPDKCCVRLATTVPSIGQTVYNAGFPYFVNFNLCYDFNPSIFQGRIIKKQPGAIMSDGCVQAGQSGGPMFDQNGSILGICISNIKIGKVVYPNINTAVPIYEIRETLENYAKTNDVSVLNNLVANNEIKRIWALEAPPILSKL